MKTQKTKDEILSIINEYKQSGLSLNKFSKERNLPLSSLSRWVREYSLHTYDDSPKFYKVTDVVKNKESNARNEYKVINVSYKNLELKFDVSILKDVLEVLND